MIALLVVSALGAAGLGFGVGYLSRAGAIERANQDTDNAEATVGNLRESLADTRAKLSSTQGDLTETQGELTDAQDEASFWYGQDHLHQRGWNCAKDLARAFRGSVLGTSYRMLPVLNSPDCQKVSPGKWSVG
jgi:hypothetical protein